MKTIDSKIQDTWISGPEPNGISGTNSAASSVSKGLRYFR